MEQGEEAAADTRARLKALGLDPLVALHIAPVESCQVDVFSAPGYATTEAAAGAFLGDARPEMVLIDGPSGPYGARFSTLPLFHSWLAPDAEIWMDDALRDSELSIARWWSELGYLSAAQLQWTGKGIVRGHRGATPRRYAQAAQDLSGNQLSPQAAEYVLLKMRVQAATSDDRELTPPFQLV